MIYTEVEKKELDEVQRVFAEHLRQCPDYELLWSDKVGYVWLAIGLEPLYVDTGRRIVSAEDLCRECLESISSRNSAQRYGAKDPNGDSLTVSPISTTPSD